MKKLTHAIKLIVDTEAPLQQAHSELAGIQDVIIPLEELLKLELALEHSARILRKLEIQWSNLRGITNSVQNAQKYATKNRN